MTLLPLLFVASGLAAVATTASPVPELTGRFVSVSANASGTQLLVDRAGERSIVTVDPNARVRERAVGGDWTTISLATLKSEEPVTIRLDEAGRAIAIDAEYAIVDTRCVIVRDGYLIGTDGAARRLAGTAASLAPIPLGAYVRLRIDPATGDAFDATVASRPFAQGQTGPAVAVTFVVQVPVNTPADATVYIATNQQRWTANAVKMSLQPGNRWTATLALAPGTTLQYKYTRGAWSAGERDASGADIPNRTLVVRAGAKTQSVNDVVARWADLPS